MWTKSDLDQLDRKVDGLRTAMAPRFDHLDKQLTDLDRDLTKHMNVHREIEQDIETLKRRPPRTAARAPRRP
jgi:hypothetical protein